MSNSEKDTQVFEPIEVSPSGFLPLRSGKKKEAPPLVGGRCYLLRSCNKPVHATRKLCANMMSPLLECQRADVGNPLLQTPKPTPSPARRHLFYKTLL